MEYQQLLLWWMHGGWSKRSHKHQYSYNAKSGVVVILGAATKKLLFIGNIAQFVPSVIAIIHHFHHINVSRTGMRLLVLWKHWKITVVEVSSYQSKCMESDTCGSLVIVTALCIMYHAVVTNASYGCYLQKVECANHAVKYYRNHLERTSSISWMPWPF